VTKLSAAELAAIAARAERATAGPWALSEKDSPDDPAWVDGQGFCDLVQVFDGTNGAVGTTWKWNENTPQHLTNARFIAAARTDIPALLGHVAALTDERDDYKRGMALVEHLHHERCGERAAAVAKLAAVEAERAQLQRDYDAIAQASGRYYEADYIWKAAEVEHIVQRIKELTEIEAAQIDRDRWAIKERDEARAALLQHVRHYGGGPHHPDDCPGNCEACDVNAAVSAVLAKGGANHGE
jgi:hypothetical protein